MKAEGKMKNEKWKTTPLSDAFWFQEGPGVRNWQFTASGIKLLNVANIERIGTLNLEKTNRHLAVSYTHLTLPTNREV